ncbi:MAG TPA: MarR family transcriptional regulator [Candidatus Omnitrophota bacterium]|nr:MarR family transcriptional regulator [Candidatus Omnitrophota bacterium]HPD84392.1 MarR family transcriptional regulator [Candidatus Omnitrophota bacterium]HRZ03250.1 MarR family transcriptional regulator [Candidatus Omnitrophota bacterium]
MTVTNRKDLSRAIARMVPYIIQGAQLGFLAGRAITHTQFFVLVSVHSAESCAMKTLAENMKVSMPTMSGIVERLVKAGLLRRLDNPGDRRQVMVGLTAEGKNVISQFQDVISRRWEEVLEILNAGEMDSLRVVMEKIAQGLGRKNKE